MALQCNYECQNGVTGTYIRVLPEPSLNEIRIHIYVNQAARDAEKSPLETILIEATDGTFSEENQKVAGKSKYVLAYDYLKTLPEFSGAIDV